MTIGSVSCEPVTIPNSAIGHWIFIRTAAVPLRRSDLLSQGDEMIRTMGWSSAQARDCLQKELGATSRQQLSDQQLMQFNMILENLMTRTDE